MNTNRFPYIAPERKHDAHPIRAIGEADLDGLMVYYAAGPIGDSIVTYPSATSAEAAHGKVRGSLLWELILDNPGVAISIKVA